MVTRVRLNGRDDHGRFAPGYRGGPGRPPLAKEHKYLATLASVCTIDAWHAICRRAVKDAKLGDHRARNWLAKYLIGDRQLPDAPAHEEDDFWDHVPADILLEFRRAYFRLEQYQNSRN